MQRSRVNPNPLQAFDVISVVAPGPRPLLLTPLNAVRRYKMPDEMGHPAPKLTRISSATATDGTR